MITYNIRKKNKSPKIVNRDEFVEMVKTSNYSPIKEIDNIEYLENLFKNTDYFFSIHDNEANRKFTIRKTQSKEKGSVILAYDEHWKSGGPGWFINEKYLNETGKKENQGIGNKDYSYLIMFSSDNFIKVEEIITKMTFFNQLTSDPSLTIEKISVQEFNKKISLSGGTRKYNINKEYEVDDIIEHPQWGKGIVSSKIANNKIEVKFNNQIKKLIHNKT